MFAWGINDFGQVRCVAFPSLYMATPALASGEARVLSLEAQLQRARLLPTVPVLEQPHPQWTWCRHKQLSGTVSP